MASTRKGYSAVLNGYLIRAGVFNNLSAEVATLDGAQILQRGDST